MRLIDLAPEWLGMPYEINGAKFIPRVTKSEDAHGIWFQCPICYREKGTLVGVHAIMVWNPTVPEDQEPNPGRWNFVGNSFHDLTLKGATSTDSVNLEKVVDGVAVGCQAHFFIRAGAIE